VIAGTRPKLRVEMTDARTGAKRLIDARLTDSALGIVEADLDGF
jgi:hypothetical protein